MPGDVPEAEVQALYPRGFALLPRVLPRKTPDCWQQTALPGGRVWACDPLLETEIWQNDSGDWLVLAGICLDTHRPTADLATIAKRMRRKLRFGRNYFLDYLDQLGGRFVLAYEWRKTPFFYTDAGGTKAAFYAKIDGGVVVSSHASLTADLAQTESGAPRSSSAVEPWRESKRAGFPGHFTPFEGVFHLTPNVRLNLNDGTTERFYPRKQLKVCDEQKLPEILKSIQQLMDTQVQLLKTLNRPLVASLSGGVDSRFVLACTVKHSRDILYFTYHHRSDYDQDLRISQELAERLKLEHLVIRWDPKVASGGSDSREYKAFLRNMKKATYLHHGHRLAWNYQQQLPANAIHIGGELSEILQAFWSTTAWYWEEWAKPFTPAKMARAYGTQGNKQIEDFFNRFDRDVSFADIRQEDGYDPFDFFYWEHRMGTWRSHVSIESDPSFDAVSLFACRKLLELGLCLPVGVRHRQQLAHLGIELYLPQAREIPIASSRPSFNKKATP